MLLRILSLMLTGRDPLQWWAFEVRSLMKGGLTKADLHLIICGSHQDIAAGQNQPSAFPAHRAAQAGGGGPAQATKQTNLIELVATNQASMLQRLSFGMRLNSDASFRQDIMKREQTYHSEGKYSMSVLWRGFASMILPDDEGAKSNSLAAYPPWSRST